MKRNISIWIPLLGLILSSCGHKDNKLTSEERQEGWTLLFDGKTLNGWRDFQGETINGPWKVEDGTLASLGQGSDSTGYLISERQYENFILTFDWIISKGGNSGVFYHVVERPLFKVPYSTGPEYQLIDEITFPRELKEWQKAGADYAMHVPDTEKRNVKKSGRWNFSKIVFNDGHVEHWLNGEKVVEFESWTDDWHTRKEGGKNADSPEYGLARRGHFALQDHGSKVWYKNIKIKKLPRKLKKKEVLQQFSERNF